MREVKTMKTGSIVGVVTALALVAAACGSDGGGDTSGPDGDAPTAGAPTATTGDDAPAAPDHAGSDAAEVAASSDAGACDAEPEVLTTEAGVAFLRTPDACFEDLSDWDYETRYLEIDGLRQAYIDEGPADGESILLLHGQPAWSYLYRDMIPELLDAGYRVVAMDHMGMGRSDKPIDAESYSFPTHVDRLETFMEEMGLEGTTLFAQDWGSIMGLKLTAERPELFDRVIIGNGGGLDFVESELPDDIEASNAQLAQSYQMIPEDQTGFQFFGADGGPAIPIGGNNDLAAASGMWAAFAFTSEDFTPSVVLEAGTYTDLTPNEEAAYDAPYPSRDYMMGPRRFPSHINENAQQGLDWRAELTAYDKPFLTIFGINDPSLIGEGDAQPWLIENIAGAAGQPHERIPTASHFLQDDEGPAIARMVDEFIQANPR